MHWKTRPAAYFPVIADVELVGKGNEPVVTRNFIEVTARGTGILILQTAYLHDF